MISAQTTDPSGGKRPSAPRVGPFFNRFLTIIFKDLQSGRGER
jgi:hypothetical protein